MFWSTTAKDVNLKRFTKLGNKVFGTYFAGLVVSTVIVIIEETKQSLELLKCDHIMLVNLVHHLWARLKQIFGSDPDTCDTIFVLRNGIIIFLPTLVCTSRRGHLKVRSICFVREQWNCPNCSNHRSKPTRDPNTCSLATSPYRSAV